MEIIIPNLGDTPNHEKPAVYREGAKWVFRAYSIGACNLKLALVATGKKEEFAASTLRAFEDGHEYEAIVKDRLRRYGVHLGDEQEELDWEILPGFALLRGHKDGWAPNGFPALPRYGLPEAINKPGIVEIKSANGSSYDEFLALGMDAYPSYRMQADAYCLEASERLGYPVGIYFVVQCKEDIRALHVRFYEGPKHRREDYQAKVIQVVSLYNRLTGGEDVLCDQHEEQTFRCPFDEHHGQPADKTELVYEDAELAEIAKQERELNAKVGDLEEQRKGLKSILEIKHRELAHDRVILAGEAGQFVLRRQKSPAAVDRRSMRRDYPQIVAIEEQYKTQSDHLRIEKYTPPKGKAKKKEEVVKDAPGAPDGSGPSNGNRSKARAKPDTESIEDLFARIGPKPRPEKAAKA